MSFLWRGLQLALTGVAVDIGLASLTSQAECGRTRSNCGDPEEAVGGAPQSDPAAGGSAEKASPKAQAERRGREDDRRSRQEALGRVQVESGEARSIAKAKAAAGADSASE
jgi:hypothetical protein